MHRLYRSQLCITLALRVTIRKQVLFPGSLAFWYRAPWPDLHDDSSSKIRSWPRPSPPRFPRPTLMPPRRRARASSIRRNRRRRRRATCCKWRSSAPAAAARSISWPYLANPHTEIAYIVDADEKIGQRRIRDVGRLQGKTPKFARDLRQALDDKSVHIVSTATPNHWHALAAIWSMQAGKDVYVEKPVSHNVSEGRRIVQVARKLHRFCQAGTQCRSMKGTIDAVNYVQVREDRRSEAGAGAVLQAPPVHRPQGPVRGAAAGRLQSVGRPGANAAADQAALPLRLALAAGMGQRRHRQSGSAPDGHRPLGPRAGSSGRPRDRLRRTPGLRRCRRRGQHRGRTVRVRRQDPRLRGPRAARPIRFAAPVSASSSTAAKATSC